MGRFCGVDSKASADDEEGGASATTAATASLAGVGPTRLDRVTKGFGEGGMVADQPIGFVRYCMVVRVDVLHMNKEHVFCAMPLGAIFSY